jgi:hypothetical protein
MTDEQCIRTDMPQEATKAGSALIATLDKVMYGLEDATEMNTDEIVIEGNYGLGESVVSGAVNPDHFEVDKNTLKTKETKLAKKTTQYIRDPKTGETVHLDVPEEKQKQPCINEEEILKLAMTTAALCLPAISIAYIVLNSVEGEEKRMSRVITGASSAAVVLVICSIITFAELVWGQEKSRGLL